jgi:succinylglutamic semialdehyde dehydrogenase
MTGKCYIDNKWVLGKGKAFNSINPSTLNTIWSGKASTTNDVSIAIDSATKAFKDWSQLSIIKRIQYLTSFAKICALEKETLAKTIRDEMGKPLWEARQEVSAMIAKINISIQAYDERCKNISKPIGEAISETKFRAHGPLVVFGPFNLPGHLPNGHIVPALLAGNTIVFKPSEQTPKVGEYLTKIWHKCKLPKGVFNMVQGSKKTGIALCHNKHIKGILFTGSFETGAAIHKQLAGQPQKILALEMGGNNPLIVHNPKSIKSAVYATIQSAYITSGQRCVCARRLIVCKNKANQTFINSLICAIKNIKYGPVNKKEEPYMGPIISKQAVKSIIGFQQDLLAKGAKPLVECTTDKINPYLVSPGLIDVSDVKDRNDCEAFGPLLQMIVVDTFEAAIEEANNTDYGLSAGILCQSEKLFKQFKQMSNAGIINWNRQITGASSSAPFGGTGKSGNFRPSAFFAADYCAYPIATIQAKDILMPDKLEPGLEL